MMNINKGVTIFELLIALTIIAILVTIATMSYTSQIRKSRRNDGIETLLAISLAETRYRSSNSQYGTLAQVWNGGSSSPDGHYSLSITNVTATSYTITATAQNDQANDTSGGTSCGALVLSETNGQLSKSPDACWPK